MNLVDRLRAEADLCENETASDIAHLLWEAADELAKALAENYRLKTERQASIGCIARSPVAWMYRSTFKRDPSAPDNPWQFTIVPPWDWGTRLMIEDVPLYRMEDDRDTDAKT